jgi:hypothetical protein
MEASNSRSEICTTAQPNKEELETLGTEARQESVLTVLFALLYVYRMSFTAK